MGSAVGIDTCMIDKAIKGMKTEKVTGSSEITAEMLKISGRMGVYFISLLRKVSSPKLMQQHYSQLLQE